MTRCLVLVPSLLAIVPSAHAHGGHVGELAGHAHWVGLAAVLGAAAIAVLLAKARKREEAAETEDTEADPEDKPEEAAV